MRTFDEIFNEKLEEFRVMGYNFGEAFDKAESAAKAEMEKSATEH
jgi:hypothetical protein